MPILDTLDTLVNLYHEKLIFVFFFQIKSGVLLCSKLSSLLGILAGKGGLQIEALRPNEARALYFLNFTRLCVYRDQFLLFTYLMKQFIC